MIFFSDECFMIDVCMCFLPERLFFFTSLLNVSLNEYGIPSSHFQTRGFFSKQIYQERNTLPLMPLSVCLAWTVVLVSKRFTSLFELGRYRKQKNGSR